MWSEEDLISADSYSHSYDDRPSRDRGQRRNPPESMPELYSIHQGRVVSIKEFGAFVQLDGFRTQGLLHRSHISKEPIQSIENVICRDERLWVKVVNVDDDPERPRFGVSMRLVAQRDGADLDPNNVELMLSEQKRKSFHDHERHVVKLDAVLPTTCTKCGAEGHLDWECYASQNKGKSYELIDDRSFDQLMTRMDSNKPSSRRQEPPEKKKKSKSSSRSDKVLGVSEISSREQALEILQEIERKKQRKKEKKRLKREREASREDERERKRRKSDHRSDRGHSRERRHSRSSSSSEKRRR